MRSRALLLLGLTACAAAPPPLTPRGDLGLHDLRFGPRTLTLPDGLRLVHEQLPGSGAVALVLTVRAGAARDPEDRRGLAHLLEHLTFRGRDEAGRTRWDRYEELGATLINAYTDHESTVYVAVVPRASLAAALALEADRLRVPLRGVTDEELAVEREVVRNELLERNERNQEGGLLAWSARALFPEGHGYRHPVAGTRESLAAIGRADARFFGARHYRPKNATLTVVGDATAEEVRQALERAGGAWNAADPDPLPDLVDVPLEPPDPPPGTIARVEGSFRGPRVWIAWTLPGTYGPAAGAGELAARVLEARVDEDYLELQGEAGRDVAEVRFFVAPGLRASTLFAEVQLREGRFPERSASAVIDGVVGLSRPPDEGTRGLVGDLTRSVVSTQVLQTEDPLVRAIRYAEADRVTGRASNAVERLGRIRAFESDSLRSYASAYLTRARARIAVVTPRREDRRSPITGLDPPLSLQSAGGAVQSAPPAAPLPSPAGARRFRLPSGLEVILWPRPGFPAVTAALLFRGGRAVADPPGSEEYLDGILPLAYCGGLPAHRGIGISTNVLPDGVLELAQGGAQNLSAILLSLAERAAAYRYRDWPVLNRLHRETCGTIVPDDDRARLWAEVLSLGKRHLEQQRLAAGRSARQQAARAIRRALLDGSAYQPASDEALDRITAGELEDWYLSSRRPERAVLLVVGQLDLAQAEALARGWFSSWRPPRPPRAPRVVPPSLPQVGPRLFRASERGADQAEVLLGCRLPSGSPAESAAAQVMVHLLMRDLRERLRQQQGATYGVGSDLLELKIGASVMTLQTDVGREHLASALGEVVGRLDALAAQPPPPALLRKSQLDVFRELAGPASTSRLAGQAIRLLMLDQPLEALDGAAAAAAQVSPQAIRAAAVACRRGLAVAAVADPGALAGLSLPGFAAEDLR
jgi:zinc protease